MALTPDSSPPDASADRAALPNVVITGVGVVSPIGIGCNAYWNSMCQRRSGIGILPATASMDLPLSMGGAIRDFDPKLYVKPRKALKVMCREIQTGFSAAALAVEQARLDPSQLSPERVGVVFGSEMLYCEPGEMVEVYSRCIEQGRFYFQRWGEVFLDDVPAVDADVPAQHDSLSCGHCS